MTHWMMRSLSLLFALCVLSACSGTEDARDPDADAVDTLDAGGGDATGSVDVVEEDVSPDTEPDVAPDVVEDVTPDTEPDVAPDVVEDVTPDAEPDVAPDVVEDVTPDAEPDTSCDPGYVLVDGVCADVDECAEGTDNCAENAACTNTDGGFTCTCDEGWFGDGVICVEDVCLAYDAFTFTRPDGEPDTIDCLSPSVCLARGSGGPLFNSLVESRDTVAGCEASVEAPAGTEWALGSCLGNEGPFAGFVDTLGCSPRSAVGQTLCLHVIAEDLYFDMDFTAYSGGGPGGGFAYTRRLVGGGVCGLGAVCETLDDGFDCACPAGTTGDGFDACEDIDECASGEGSCGVHADCVNTYGGFDCACWVGFEGDPSDRCDDVDECALGTDDCGDSALCFNQPGSFACGCEAGFELTEANECVDLDECALGTDDCGEGSSCVNTTGGFFCACDPGYTLVEDVCEDVDECALYLDDCPDGTGCVNTAGGFTCVCPDGFVGDGTFCIEDLGCDPTCGADELCVNTGQGDTPPECICGPGSVDVDGTCTAVGGCSPEKTIVVYHPRNEEPDCISPNVCLTRPPSGGFLYNTRIASDTSDDGKGANGGNPGGTLWAEGRCGDDGLRFNGLNVIAERNPRSLQGKDLCLHLVLDDVFVDLRFLDWGSGSEGRSGAFTYLREDPFPCAVNATCVETPDGVECVCDTDFIPEGDACVYDGPCDLTCGENASCVTDAFGPLCACDAGFQLDVESFACVDANECLGEPIVNFVHRADDPADCLTPSVCLNRSSAGGPIYNEVLQSPIARGCDTEVVGTEWAIGTCDSAELSFGPFASVHGCSPPSLVGQDLCMRAVAEDEFFDIRFTDWGSGEERRSGEFAYLRSSASPCSRFATCENTVGAYACTCDEDFTGDGVDCVYDGPCDLDCGANGACEITPTGPICTCDPGYELDGTACVDIDECAGTVTVTLDTQSEDCVAPDVCLGRSIGGPLYNTLREPPGQNDGCRSALPSGTEWALGTCAFVTETGGAFSSLLEAASCSGRNIGGSDFCMRLPSTGELIDFNFIEWNSLGAPVRTRYTRTRVSPCGVNETCTNEPGTFSCTCEDPFATDGEVCTEETCEELACSTGACTYDAAGDATCVCPEGTAPDTSGACVSRTECTFFDERSGAFNDGDEALCLSPTTCLARNTTGPWYNPDFESGPGSVLEGVTPSGVSPYGYLFARGACDTPNLSFTTFDKLDRNPPALIYRELCLSNELTGERFDLMLTGWETGRPADFATTERFSIRWEDVTAPLCRDGRVCSPDSAESVSCACPAGTLADASGACVDIDNCADNPCGLGGVCFDIGDDYACVCPDEQVRFEKESFEVSDGDCVAPDICLNRDDTGPLYNASRETGGAAGDNDHRPDGVRFRPGACDGTRWFDELFSSNVSELFTRLNLGIEDALACAQLVETGVEFEMRFTRYDDSSGGSIDSIDGSRGFIDEGPSGGAVAWERDAVYFGSPCGAPDAP